MAVWDTKYESTKYGLETNASFRYFQRIITEFKPPFNLRKCAEKFVKEEIDNKQQIIVEDDQFNEISKELQENYIPKSKFDLLVKRRHNSLNTYSNKFNWRERFNEYYDYFVDRNQRNKLIRIADWEESEIEFAMKRPSFANDDLQKIHRDEELSTVDKQKAKLDNQKTYKEAVDTVYTIFNGGKTRIEAENTGELNLNHQVNRTIEELEEEYENYFKELQSELETDKEDNNNNNTGK